MLSKAQERMVGRLARQVYNTCDAKGWPPGCVQNIVYRDCRNLSVEVCAWIEANVMSVREGRSTLDAIDPPE